MKPSPPLADILSWKHIVVSFLYSGQAVANNLFAPCFYPNGDLEPNDMPCSDEGGACCPPRWVCQKNGLCYLPNEGNSPNNTIERHTCTDESWGDLCPIWCRTDNRSVNMGVCDFTAVDTGSLCCGSGCCEDNNIEKTPAGNMHYLTSLGDLPPSWATSLQSMIEASTTDQTSATDHTETIFSISVLTITALGPSPSSLAFPTATSSLGSESFSGGPMTNTDSPNQSSTPKIVGTAVGIPIGLAAFALLFYLLRRRYLKNSVPEAPNPGTETSSTYVDNTVIARPELAEQPNSIFEMPSHRPCSELDVSTRANSIPSNGELATMTADEGRWSVVSSLAPPRVMTPPAGVAPMAAGLQAIRQQHHDTSRDSIRSQPRQNNLHERSNSAILPVIEAGSDNFMVSGIGEGNVREKDLTQGDAMGQDKSAQRDEIVEDMSQNVDTSHQDAVSRSDNEGGLEDKFHRD